MNPQNIGRRLFLGSGVGALALRPLRTAQADTTFTNFSFAARGAPAPRTMPERLSDIINVKDWGAFGDNSHNDTQAIQNAVNYCLSATGGKQPGGTVFFPPGVYICGAIEVSSGYDVGVILKGSAREATFLTNGAFSGVNGTYDNIERVEGMTLGSIRLTRTGAVVEHCSASIDASEAVNAGLTNVSPWGPGPRAANSGYGYPPCQPGTIGVSIGNGGAIVNCRSTVGNDVGIAVSGSGVAVLGSACENQNTSVRLGWGTRRVVATSNNGSGKIRLRLTTNSDLIDGGSYYVVGVSGVADYSTCVISVIADGVSVDLPNNSYTSPSSGGKLIGEIPAYGCAVIGYQAERCNSSIELYNAHGCFVSGVLCNGWMGTPSPEGPISNMTYVAGSPPTVTVTTSGNHNIPAGTHILQIGVEGLNPFGFIPTGSETAGWCIATSPGPNSNTFSYRLASGQANPGAYVSGGMWNWPLQYGMRSRIATECIVEHITTSGQLVSFDLDYGGQAKNCRNNIFFSTLARFGWLPPTNASRPLGGWKFLDCWSDATNPTFSPSSVSDLNARRVFADLPGQPGVYQNGPFEGQEFDITDGQLSSGGTASWNQLVAGGSSGHYKVRYNSAGASGAGWYRIA